MQDDKEKDLSEILSKINELFQSESEQIVSLFDLSQIRDYYIFLKQHNQLGGFFSSKDSENILERHILESVYYVFKIAEKIPVSHETKIADVGTGPGLPGFLFRCLKNPPVVYLVDSQKRRLHLLENYCREGRIDQVFFLYQRAEEVQEKFDIIAMRSAVPYPWSAEIVYSLMNKNSLFCPFLAKLGDREKPERTLLDSLGMSVEETMHLSALSFLGERNIKFLKKSVNPKHGFPRQWSAISKEIKTNG